LERNKQAKLEWVRQERAKAEARAKARAREEARIRAEEKARSEARKKAETQEYMEQWIDWLQESFDKTTEGLKKDQEEQYWVDDLENDLNNAAERALQAEKDKRNKEEAERLAEENRQILKDAKAQADFEKSISPTWATAIKPETSIDWVLMYIRDLIFWVLATITIWVLLFLWIKMLMAQWKEEEFKKATQWFVSVVIWLALIWLAYALVKIVSSISLN